MPLEFVKYNQTGAQPYTEATIIKPVKHCNGFIATNTGDEIAFVNDRILYPGVPGTNNGDSVSVGGNLGEEFVGIIRIYFGTGGGGNPAVTVDQKQYVIDEI